MIKDRLSNETYFTDTKKFIDWLNIDAEIAKQCILSVDDCKTEQDYCDFANEYELKLQDGAMVHDWAVLNS